MTTDKTWFDDKLKSNLFLDIGFRTAVWLSIAFLTIEHASRQAGFSPITVLDSSFKGLMPVVTDVVRVCLVLCFLALILKDLEHVAPEYWAQGTLIGKVGGVVRRLAGDLSLWVVGALITLLASLSVFVVFLHKSNGWSDGARDFTVVVALMLLVSIAIFSTVSVWVRRDISLVSSHARFLEIFNSAWKVVGFYVTLILVTWLAD